MSFPQLSQHARDIQRLAIQREIHANHHGVTPGMQLKLHPELARQYDDIPELFQPFIDMPDPAAFKKLAGDVEGAMKLLSSGDMFTDPIDGSFYPANAELGKIPGCQATMYVWTGHAAQQFERNFVAPFQSVTCNQFIIAAVLKSALDATRRVWENAQANIDAIAHKTMSALDAGKPDLDGWTVAFTVASSIATAAITLMNPELSVADIVLSGITAAAPLTALAPSETVDLSATTPAGTVSRMREAIAQLAKEIDDAESMIQKGLDNANKILTENRSLFVAPRPELAGATPANIKSDEYMGQAY